jgi:hypothetical protein
VFSSAWILFVSALVIPPIQAFIDSGLELLLPDTTNVQLCLKADIRLNCDSFVKTRISLMMKGVN